jgi:hypothetical protein
MTLKTTLEQLTQGNGGSDVNLQERIDELLRLEAEATPGEWSFGEGSRIKGGDARTVADLRYINGGPNGRFIAAARNIVKPLCAAYRAALTALEASHQQRDAAESRVKELEAELARLSGECCKA